MAHRAAQAAAALASLPPPHAARAAAPPAAASHLPPHACACPLQHASVVICAPPRASPLRRPRLRLSRQQSAPPRASAAAAPQAGSIYAEEGPEGRYLEAVVTSFHRVGHGAIVGLLCTPRCAGLSAEEREFPLFLSPAAASEVAAAVDRGGLPASLFALEDLHQKDVRLMYIDALCADATSAPSGAFFVYDLVSGSGQRVGATYAEALGMAIRYQEPVLLGREALVGSTAEFLGRMVVAHTQEGSGGDAADVALLRALSARWAEAAATGAASAQAVAAAVAAEDFGAAASAKQAGVDAAAALDAALPSLLAQLRQLYAQSTDLFTRM